MTRVSKVITGNYNGRRFELIQRRAHFDVIEYKRVEGYLLGFENGDVKYVFDYDPLLKFDPIKTEEEVKEAEALTIAIEAMKKQEPMRPVIEQGAPSYYGGSGICREYCACPKCGEAVGRGDDKPNYCPECGQKLDWED